MNILFIDDEINLLNSIKRSLLHRKDWNQYYINEPLKALQIIKNIDFDLIVLDFKMPIMNGHELLLKLNEEKSTQSIPKIMLTASSENRLKFHILKEGALDFLEKPISFTELELKISNLLKMKQMINSLNSNIDELEKLNQTDELTKAFNRKYLFEYIDKMIYLKKRYDRNFLVLMFDIDNFKNINDNYGHHEGDRVLKEIRTKLKRCLRKSDKLCRYGGDEFIIVFSDTNLSEAKYISTKILNQIHSIKIGKKHLTISGGLVQYKTGNNKEICKKADQYLFKSKKAGKNRISSKYKVFK